MADDTASYITNLYQTMLGRAPEAGAIDYWSTNPTGNIALGIFGSQEYGDRLSQTYNQYGNDPAALNAQLKAQGWTDSGTGPMKPPGYGQFATNYMQDVAKKEAATATNGWGSFAPPAGHSWSSVYPNAGVQQPGQQTYMPYNAAPPAWLQGLMTSINNSKGVQGSSLYGGTNSTSMYTQDDLTALNSFMQALLAGKTGV